MNQDEFAREYSRMGLQFTRTEAERDQARAKLPDYWAALQGYSDSVIHKTIDQIIRTYRPGYGEPLFPLLSLALEMAMGIARQENEAKTAASRCPACHDRGLVAFQSAHEAGPCGWGWSRATARACWCPAGTAFKAAYDARERAAGHQRRLRQATPKEWEDNEAAWMRGIQALQAESQPASEACPPPERAPEDYRDFSEPAREDDD